MSADRSTAARNPYCVERWPECESGAYDPRCCRFPKSCSCNVLPPDPTPASDAATTRRNTLRTTRLWREGRHWQIERGPLAAWAGIASDRVMVGVIWNHESWSLGFGLGPLYFGIGAAYDR